MKLAWSAADGRVRATVAGDLEVSSCTCLENFWALRLADAVDLEVDLSGVDAADLDGTATLVALVLRQREHGGRVVVTGAPQGVRRALAANGLRSDVVAGDALGGDGLGADDGRGPDD